MSFGANGRYGTERSAVCGRAGAESASPRAPLSAQQIASHHEETAPPQIGAEGEIYDPPFFRKGGLTRPDGSGGFGPMATNDFGNDLDIPTVIRNLSD